MLMTVALRCNVSARLDIIGNVKMSNRAHRLAKERALALYEDIDPSIKEDLVEAAIWARDTLMKHEGEGHHFELSANHERLLCCSFAKPSWSGDHSGSYMPTAAG